MAKSKKQFRNASKLELENTTPQEPDANDWTDPSVLAAVLSADYPLIDSSLIYALISDYDPSSLSANLPNIRDQLAILEATLVPDPDEPPTRAESVEATPSYSTGDEELSNLRELRIGTNAKETNRNPSASSSSQASSPNPGAAATSGTSTSGSVTESTSIGEEEEGFVDEPDLLKALFPTMSPAAINEALSSALGLSEAIDHLLSVELIKTVEKEGAWPDEGDDVSDGEERQTDLTSFSDVPPPARSSSDNSRTRSRKAKQRIVPLVDTLQRKPSPLPSRPSSRSSSLDRTSARHSSAITSSGPSPNAWLTMASLADYLSSLLPLNSSTYFLKYCHSPKYHSAYAAIKASLMALPHAPRRVDQDEEEEERCQSVLEEIYGVSLLGNERDKQIQHDLEVCVRVTGADVATVMDLMDLLAEISQWPGDDDYYDSSDEDAVKKVAQGSMLTKPSSPSQSVPTSPKLSSVSAPLPTPTPRPPPVFNPNRITQRPVFQTTTISTDRIIPGSRPPPGSDIVPTTHYDHSKPPETSVVRAAKAAKHPGGIQHIQNWRTVSHARQTPNRSSHLHPLALNIPSYARGTLPHDSTPGSLKSAIINETKAGNLSIDECLSRASIERAKREDAIRMAGRHFRSSSSGVKHGGLVAGHYAAQARQAGERARQWELKAARLVINHQLTSTGGRTIDLHHLTIKEAETLSLEAAEEWLGSGRDGPLRIVTGVGRHSAGGRGVLGPAVANALERGGWKVDRGENSRGYVVVRGKR